MAVGRRWRPGRRCGAIEPGCEELVDAQPDRRPGEPGELGQLGSRVSGAVPEQLEQLARRPFRSRPGRSRHQSIRALWLPIVRSRIGWTTAHSVVSNPWSSSVSDPPLSVQLYTVRDAIAADLDAALGARRRDRLPHRRAVRLRRARSRVRRPPGQARTASPRRAHAPLLDGDVPRRSSPRPRGRRDHGDRPDERTAIAGTRSRASQRIAAMLNAAREAAADHGIRVGYHNHWWEPAADRWPSGVRGVRRAAAARGRARGRHLLGARSAERMPSARSSVSATGCSSSMSRTAAITHEDKDQVAVGSGSDAGARDPGRCPAGRARRRARRLSPVTCSTRSATASTT